MISRGAYGLPPFSVVDSNGETYVFPNVTMAHDIVGRLYRQGITAAVYNRSGQLVECSDLDGTLIEPSDGPDAA